jgi:hypothetical protein
MALRPVQGDVALPAGRPRRRHLHRRPRRDPGAAGDVVLLVHCTAATGTTPTLDVSLEESADGTSWSAVAGSAAAQLTAAGNRVAYAAPSKALVRVTATVAGTTPSVTFRAALMIL